MALSPKPDFKLIESKWQKFWLDNKIFSFDRKSKKKVFSIDTPPPYISGELHMGHGASYTGFEFIARYKRMMGFNVFFPIGFDDNGQPTERFVEKKYKIKSSGVPREKFIELCLKETAELTKVAKEQLTRLGHSYDWDLFYSTISPKAVKIAQQSFLDLHEKKLVYRAEEPGLLCIHCQTGLSQADIEDEERETTLNYVDFNLEGGKKIQIATTRPELLPACVGIFVHPNDKQYKNLIGKTATVPLFNQKIKIMADEKVDQNFGTGAVMICTFGDKTDIEWWRKHKLETKIIFNKAGKLDKLAGKFEGFELHEAKQAIINELQKENFLVKQEKLKQNVGTCWRCHNPVELLPSKQWAIKVLPSKKQLLAQAKKIKWHPQYHKHRFDDWVNGLSWDWIISRQRYYGVPMPLWYCKACGAEILPNEKDLPVYPSKDLPKTKCKCGSKDFVPELDVFDTWMTSSLTPFIAKDFGSGSIPYSMRPQGYEIIRTWAFYTILKSYFHFKKLPWKDIMVNGLILGPDGRAMHKSYGNVINPLDVVEKFGSDALRYFASTVNVGENTAFQEKELAHAQRLLIKLWNVARFVEMWEKDLPKELGKKPKLHWADSWVLSRISQIVEQYKNSFDNYDPVSARRVLEQFFWNEYCDFYLEMIKPRLYGNAKEEKLSAVWAVYKTLFKLIRLWAPILSHTTEEIYQDLFRKKNGEESVHLCKIPKVWPLDKKALEFGSLAVEAIAAIRKWKADNKLGIGAEVEKLTLQHPKAKDLEKVKTEIAATMRVKGLEIKEGELKVF